ncbi:unnamed protein product [Rhizoctonia solani]|uniref:Uncharacterized protein n=1 Tax=Rhizoctonia solani TaxID=456999 RepID=A0A8H3B947_9AGAM|nr:unnamed protein product [Rhizoctonia solani]
MPHLPGSTHRIANASVVASRKLVGREPVRIEFIKEWAEGNPLFDWYAGRPGTSGRLVYSIQLRKERKQPFFHEYLVLCMGNQKNAYFRLERRQLENEDQPLNSLLEYGVEAYDTIEKTFSFEKHVVSSSCVAQIDFEAGIHIAVILEICRAIQKHPSAKVYTLQRFNCYFFAQTILLCTARATYQSNDMTHMITHIITKYDGVNIASDTERPTGGPSPYKKSDLSPLMLLKEISRIPSFIHNAHCFYCWSRNPLLWERDMDSINNIQNLFWDGASRVIQQVLHSINAGGALQNVLWSTDSGQRLRDVCNAFMFWVVCDEWETLQNPPSGLTSSHEQLGAGCTQEIIADIQRSVSNEHESIAASPEPGPESQLEKHGARRSSDSSNHQHPREFKDLLSESYIEARKELIELVSEACKQDALLSTYYSERSWPIKGKTLPLPSEPENTSGFWGHLKLPEHIRRFRNSNMTEETGFKPFHDYVDQLIQAHAKRVAEYELLLRCTSDEVVNGMRVAMDDVWKSVCAMDLSTSVWEL